MSTPEERPRADLAALRIHRDEDRDEPGRRLPIGRIIGWIVVLAVLGIAASAGYQLSAVPRRAPVVEPTTIKPTVNVANPPLMTATGYLVANRTAKITPKISGRVVKLNIDTGMNVRRGDVLAVLESTNL